MRLVRKTDMSYYFYGDLNDLSSRLTEQGCIKHEPATQYEHSRMLFRSGGGCYIILYHSGSVVLQGKNIEGGREMLLDALGPFDEPKIDRDDDMVWIIQGDISEQTILKAQVVCHDTD